MRAHEPDGLGCPFGFVATHCLTYAQANSGNYACRDTKSLVPRQGGYRAVALQATDACGLDGKLCLWHSPAHPHPAYSHDAVHVS